MSKKKGDKKSGGRVKGTPNKFTTTVKEAYEIAFNELQKDKDKNLLSWGKKNPTEFYKLSSKLLPLQVNATLMTESDISLNLTRPEGG